MKIRVMLFAQLRELAGTDTLEIDGDEIMSVGEIKKRLYEKFPQLREAMGRALCAVNEEYARDEVLVREGDRIALIPPVSGGACLWI